jgi:hypothetical protein
VSVKVLSDKELAKELLTARKGGQYKELIELIKSDGQARKISITEGHSVSAAARTFQKAGLGAIGKYKEKAVVVFIKPKE